MARHKEIGLQRVGWDESFDDLFAGLSFPPHESIETLRNGVETGRIGALGAFDFVHCIAASLYRFEDGDLGTEMVILATAGRVPGGDLIATVLPVLEVMARAAGAGSIRFHTERDGLVKKMASHGYGFSEVIMRKVL